MPLGVPELDARSRTYGKPIVTPNNAAMMNNRDIIKPLGPTTLQLRVDTDWSLQ